MSVDALLEKLSKVRKTGPDSWIACCPHHKDRSPSMTIRDLPDGRVLIHCFAGCPPNDILGSVGLSFDALFPEKLREQHYRPMRVPFNAHDMLKCLREEIDRVILVACDLEKGKPLSVVDKQRFAQAVSRIRNAERLANGE